MNHSTESFHAVPCSGRQGARFALLAAACLGFSGCGGGGGGNGDSGGGDGGGTGGGGSGPAFVAADDLFFGVTGGRIAELDVLGNDTLADAVACTAPSKVGATLSINPDTQQVEYLAPAGFVGTDQLRYVAEDANGNRRSAAVTVRVDDYTATGTSAAATGSGQFPTTILAAPAIDEVPVLRQVNVNEPVRIEPVPAGRGPGTRHRLQAVLQEGAAYHLSIDYNTREDPPGLAYWSQYPVAWFTDRNSADLVDVCRNLDSAYYDGYACGFYSVYGLIEFDYQPRETQTHNLYISSEVYDPHDTPTAVTCDQIESSGCGYDLLIEETDDNRGTTSTRRAIGGAPVHGNLESFIDEDWFRLSVYETEKTFIEVVGEADWKGRTLDNFFLALRNASGTAIQSVISSNGRASLDYAPAESEVIFVSVRGLLADVGGYRIDATGGDVPADTGTYATLALDTPVAGRISRSSEADWYRVYLEADTRYVATIDTLQAEIPSPILTILDGRGEAMFAARREPDTAACGADCTIRHELSFLPSRSGTYFVSAASRRGAALEVGNYQLAIAEDPRPGPADDFAGDSSTIARTGTYYSLRGGIEQIGDTDWFSFYSYAGDKRVFYVDGAGSGAGTLSGISTRIVDSTGVVLASGGDWESGGQVVEFSADVANDYFLVVDSDGGTGSYVVHSDSGDPDDSADTWSYLGVGGEVGGHLYSVSDVDWYRVSLNNELAYDATVAGVDEGHGVIGGPILELRNLQGERITGVGPEDGSVAMTVRNPPTGNYFLVVRGRYTRQGGYRLSLTAQGAADCAL